MLVVELLSVVSCVVLVVDLLDINIVLSCLKPGVRGAHADSGPRLVVVLHRLGLSSES